MATNPRVVNLILTTLGHPGQGVLRKRYPLSSSRQAPYVIWTRIAIRKCFKVSTPRLSTCRPTTRWKSSKRCPRRPGGPTTHPRVRRAKAGSTTMNSATSATVGVSMVTVTEYRSVLHSFHKLHRIIPRQCIHCTSVDTNFSDVVVAVFKVTPREAQPLCCPHNCRCPLLNRRCSYLPSCTNRGVGLRCHLQHYFVLLCD